MARPDWTTTCRIVTLLLVGGMWMAFCVYTATNWLAFPQFVLMATVWFVLPGWMLLRLLRITFSPIEAVAVAACLGMATTCAAYCLVCWLGVPLLLWAWPLLALWQVRPELSATALRDVRMRGEHALLLLVLAATWLPIPLLRYFGPNLALLADGGMSYYVPLPDIALHTAIAGELTHTFPPQAPQFAGQPLSYHIGMDVVTAVLARLGGLSIADLVARFCPWWFVTLDVLAIFSLGRRFLGSGYAGAAVAFLTVLGEDFAFVPGLLGSSDITLWGAYYFQVPTIFSFYFTNPMAMGLAFLFAGLVCVHKGLDAGRVGYLIAAALCLAALVEVKIFVFVLMALSVLVAAGVELAIYRRTTFLRLGVSMALLSLPFGLFVFHSNAGGGGIAWTVSSRVDTYVTTSAARMHLPAIASALAVSLPLYLIGVSGFRTIGILELIKSLKPSRSNLFAGLLALFVVIGFLLALMTKIVPRAEPDSYDNAVWFLAAAKDIMPMFAVAALAGRWQSAGWRRRAAMLVIVAAISLPSTLEFFFHVTKDRPLTYWDKNTVAAIDALNKAATPGQVVLTSAENIDTMIMARTRLRLAYMVLYTKALIRPELIEARERDIREFQRSWARQALATEVVARYGADWIIAPHAGSLWASKEATLEMAFDNDAFTLFRVRR